MKEKALLSRYKELERKIDNSISDDTIEQAQIERKEIRDELVKQHGWARKEANEKLCK